MSRNDLTDAQWQVLEPLLPQSKPGRGRARTRMTELIADKGFDSAAFRRQLTKRGIKTCIPTRQYKHRRKRGQPPRFSAASYAEQWRVERLIYGDI